MLTRPDAAVTDAPTAVGLLGILADRVLSGPGDAVRAARAAFVVPLVAAR